MRKNLKYIILCLFILIASSVVSAQSSDESQVLAIVNQERATAGLGALAWDSCLGSAAYVHNQDMIANGFFAHTSASNGSTPSQRASVAGNPSTAIGENIAAGQTSPASVMSAWMGSSGHRANILGTSYTHIGISRVNNHWTQVFGNAGCSGSTSTTSTTTSTNTTSSSSDNSNLQSTTNTAPQIDPGLCGSTIALSGTTTGVACRLLNANGVGNQAVLDMGLVNAVDISGNVSGQLTVCLQGTGNMIFLDSAGVPRTPAPIASYSGSNGTTCATLTTTGTLALVGGQSTIPSSTTTNTTPTSSVTVTTTTTTTVTTNINQTTVIGDTFTHVVQTGDNLFRIGLRYNVHFTELATLNGIDSTYRIYVGQVLVIPVR